MSINLFIIKVLILDGNNLDTILVKWWILVVPPHGLISQEPERRKVICGYCWGMRICSHCFQKVGDRLSLHHQNVGCMTFDSLARSCFAHARKTICLVPHPYHIHQAQFRYLLLGYLTPVLVVDRVCKQRPWLAPAWHQRCRRWVFSPTHALSYKSTSEFFRQMGKSRRCKLCPDRRCHDDAREDKIKWQWRWCQESHCDFARRCVLMFRGNMIFSLV